MHATPNQHLLTLPSSPVGKSSDLHAEVQQFKPNSGHKFFFLHTYTHFFAHAHTYTCTRALVCVCMCMCVCVVVYTLITAWCTCLHPYFGQFFLLSVAVACYTLSRKIKKINREEENREESVFFGALIRKTTVLESKPRR